MPWICSLTSSVACAVRRDSFLYLGGDHGEAASGFAGARGLDGGVERQQRGLPGDGLDELDHRLDALRRIGQRVHGCIGARQFGAGAFGRFARLDHLLRRIHHQCFDVARRGSDTGDFLGCLRGGVGGRRHLLRHVAVALAELRGGAPDALAGIGEGVDHFFDGAAKLAGEEQPAGVMQPRFGLTPALVDADRVGLDQRGAYRFRGVGKPPDGAVADQFGQRGVAIAAGNAVDRGDDAGEAGFGEGADQRGADEADHQRGDNAGLQARRHRQADHESGHRNPQRGTRNWRSVWRRHWRPVARFPHVNSPEDGFKFLSRMQKSRKK